MELAVALVDAVADAVADALADTLADGEGVGLQGSQQAPGSVALPAHWHKLSGQALSLQGAPLHTPTFASKRGGADVSSSAASERRRVG